MDAPDRPPEETPLMDRPLASLLQVKIGTVVKGYLLYVAIGLVLFLIAASVVLTGVGSGSSGVSNGNSKLLSWGATAGDPITPAQFRAMKVGMAEGTVRARLGTPASHGPEPTAGFVTPDDCLGYRSTLDSGTLFTFCFASGLLTNKQKY